MDPEMVKALREQLQPEIAKELMRSWEDGMRSGLEMAAKMADAVLQAPDLCEVQSVIARSLRDSLRDAKSKVGQP